jgi:hypothetical protein
MFLAVFIPLLCTASNLKVKFQNVLFLDPYTLLYITSDLSYHHWPDQFILQINVGRELGLCYS